METKPLLPIGILVDILPTLCKHINVIQLWKCGNKLLNHHLESNVVRKLHLEDRWMSSTSRWPTAIASFRHLTSLTMYKASAPMPCGRLSRELQRLPPTMEELVLEFPGALLALLNHTDPDASQSCTNLVSTTHGKVTSCMWNVGAVLPVLKKLAAWDIEKTGCNALTLDDLIVLPPKLTQLELSATITEGSFSHLPRSLETLFLLPTNLSGLSDITFANLPPNLKRISGYSISRASEVALLPESLTSIGFLLQSCTELSVELACNLPPNLTELKAIPYVVDHGEFTSAGFKSWTESLPQTLTSITFGRSRVRCIDISHLPDSVTEIRELTLLEGEKISDALDVLPLGIKTLHFTPDTAPFRYGSAGAWIPRTVEVIENMEMDSFSDFEISAGFLPPSLRRLSISGNNISFYGALPQELIQLQCDGNFEFNVRPALPPTLEEFSFKTTRSSNEYLETLQELPSALNLRIVTLSLFKTSDFGLLPRQLLAFNVQFLDGPSSEEAFAALPSTLELFSIHTWLNNSNKFSPSHFSSLPPSLTHLALHQPHLPPETLRYLPKTLQTVKLTLGEPSPEDLENLPFAASARLFLPLCAELLTYPSIAAVWPEEALMRAHTSQFGWLCPRQEDLLQRAFLFPDPRIL